jgi:hypothetical protein
LTTVERFWLTLVTLLEVELEVELEVDERE